MAVELKIDYKGAISNPDNIKKDIRKALRISLLSAVSGIIVTVGLYFLARFIGTLLA